MYIDVHSGVVVASRLKYRPRKPIIRQVVDFQVHFEADFKLRKLLNTQTLKVFYGLFGPLSVQPLGWAFYASDLVTTVEGETTKSAKIILVCLPVLSIFNQGIEAVLSHKIVWRLALSQRIKGVTRKRTLVTKTRTHFVSGRCLNSSVRISLVSSCRRRCRRSPLLEM